MRASIAEFAARGSDEYEMTVRDFVNGDNSDITRCARRALAARDPVDAESIKA